MGTTGKEGKKTRARDRQPPKGNRISSQRADRRVTLGSGVWAALAEAAKIETLLPTKEQVQRNCPKPFDKQAGGTYIEMAKTLKQKNADGAFKVAPTSSGHPVNEYFTQIVGPNVQKSGQYYIVNWFGQHQRCCICYRLSCECEHCIEKCALGQPIGCLKTCQAWRLCLRLE